MSRHPARRSIDLRIVACVAVVALCGACASSHYAPEPVADIGFLARAEIQEQEGIRVLAAVPTRDEAERALGLDVRGRGIQPIWLEIYNATDTRVRFAPVGTDATYFSPIEVAYMHKGEYRGQGYADLERTLYETAMNRWIWPGETRAGFVYTHHDPGTKAFNVDLFTATGSTTFTYFIEVPDQIPDHADVDVDSLYSADEIRDLDLAGLRSALAEMTCCAADHTGQEQGLPINVVLVGEGLEVLRALLRAGWFERARVDKPEDIAQEQHWDGRPPDAVFRTRRSGTGDRNELRVWRAPLRVEGEPVWVAQITHYVGRGGELFRAFFDPRLDPDIDEARNYMLQLMWYAQALESFGWSNDGPVVRVDAPSVDFRGVGYFTDGVRSTLWLSGEPISQIETTTVGWDAHPRRVGR